MTLAIKFEPSKLIPSRSGSVVLQCDNLTSLTLDKGVNIVQDYQYESIKNHPSFVEYLKIGAINVVKEEITKETPSIANRNAKDVLLLVKTCHEIEELKAWLKEESESKGRVTIVDAINDRIKELEEQKLTKLAVIA